MKQFIFCIIALLSSTAYAEDIYAPIPVYAHIKDIYHPTLDDYRLIQSYLTHGERSIIKWLKDYEPNARNFKLIGNTEDELPVSGMIAVNCDENEKENCLVVYSSFNKNYPRGLKRLIDFVSKSDFKGHILYQIGGWPNTEGGSLVLAHVPYAFKTSFFKEAERRGYKRAFWLDTAILPIVSLNKIFDMIKEKGYFIMGNTHMVGPYMNEVTASAFGLTVADTNKIPSCSAGLTGIDFTSRKGKDILDAWYQAAHNKVAFFSPRSDQNVLSILLYSRGISDFVSISKLAHSKNAITPDSLFLIEREFVNELSVQR